MEWGLIGIGAALVLAVVGLGRNLSVLRRDAARMERKLNAILKRIDPEYDEFDALSDRVKEIARDPNRKIEAIKAHREETGAGLKDAKDAIEAFQASLRG